MPGARREPDDDSEDEWDTDESDEWVKPCPYCGEEMFDDAPRCPSCGRYLSHEDAPSPRRPAWILITAVVLLIVMLSWAVNWF